ncbi:Panacea domain-containing protein [Psychrobacillus lasiicapitis]|uniref:DUF4065 domain-containing protein n=1 Tax=Psychrobacillus lasiicapitis TaxID=1636719 RepID=A0A544TAK0_9BACI|nr:Panacea domain-containing protein [Psychrobacillus lasiicapitis]TQR14483.1 DUF4065 domain-containing protein [Psychrobacillus lasiicapitis]GGA30936.1 hypothetical protein GCM10011384_20560 [Psychrobacillus lasiicapitis]
MVKLKYLLRYFTLKYPYKSELSKARLTKMVYLADWFSAKRDGKQITKIDWYFDHYGPFVTDVYEEAKKDKKLEIKHEWTAFGTPKETIYLKNDDDDDIVYKITRQEQRILDQVINETKFLNWSEFIDYVYNTYPIRTQDRYNFLNLIQLAKNDEE